MTTFRFSLFLRGALLDVKATLRDLHLDLELGLVRSVHGLQRGFPERLSREAELAAEEAASLICESADRLTRECLLKPEAALPRAAEDFSQAQHERYDHHHAGLYRGPDCDGAPSPWR